jgi:hypothetical protein
MLSTREYLLKLERNLMVGGGRWVADFSESFWDYPLGDVTFAMFIRGGMRPKGLALSRFVAFITVPNYRVACFAYAGDPSLKRLPAAIKAARRCMEGQEIEWSWLVFPGEGAFSPQARARIEKNDARELGIALVDLSAQEIVTSRSYVGRRMSRFINCFR